ncbi:hypothetical protein HY412_00680 [Candidatus Kaiserbacteria bacterium]|nr:hypothetical protein [Candidatus Kaiserbacteria bacterium]
MNDMQTNVERNVMRRIRLIRLLVLIISTATFAILTFVAAMWGIGKEVWVARVLENAPTDFSHLPNFFFAAFIHTSLIVQVLIVLTISSLLFLIRELARTISRFFNTSRA